MLLLIHPPGAVVWAVSEGAVKPQPEFFAKCVFLQWLWPLVYSESETSGAVPIPLKVSGLHNL